MANYYIGEVGTPIYVNVGIDVSTATTLELHVKKPSGKVVVWEASLNGTSELEYVTLEGDWDEAGEYHLHSYIVMSTWAKLGKMVTFEIKRKFS